MTYRITFLESAKKEWDNLPKEIQKQIKAKLLKIKEYPCILKNKLSGLKDCYKMKLRASGYRLVYRIYEGRLVIQIVAVAKRDKSEVYNLVRHRID
jgi:mRNA interferase RelE/StbE